MPDSSTKVELASMSWKGMIFLPWFVCQCVCEGSFSPQSPLSFQGSIVTPRRGSKGSVFSFRGRVHSENNYADDEQSIVEETGSRRDSLFLPPRPERLHSTLSKSSLTPRILLPSNGKARYVVDSNGMVMVSGGASSPNSPSGILTPEVSRKKATFDESCVRERTNSAQTLHGLWCAVVFFSCL